MKITDTDRINFIEKLMNSEEGTLTLKSKGKKYMVDIFTIPSQWQRANSAREAIDVAIKFERGDRDWKRENWPPELRNK